MTDPHAESPVQPVLVVDDDREMRSYVTSAIRREGYEPIAVSSVAEARSELKKRPFSLVVTDLAMPGETGDVLVQHVRETAPHTRVIVITAYPDEDRMLMLEELSIDAYLIKPFSVKQLRFSLLAAMRKHSLSEGARSTGDEEDSLGLIGSSHYIHRLRAKIRLMAGGDFPVLIEGPSGTGKELVARAIHTLSPRSEGRLVSVNCGAIPDHLEESEFFGHAKGAFTGASGDKTGLVQAANNGTLFLDEIGELSLNVQAKLLRVLDCGEYMRVGEVEPSRTNLRTISATNRELQAMVDEGTFRGDLYYRLRAASLKTEPLSTHTEDVPELVRHFAQRFSPGKAIADDAVEMLCRCDWPGNTRELRNTVQVVCSLDRTQKVITSAQVSLALELPEPAQPVPRPEPAREPAAPTPSDAESFTEAKLSFERQFFADLLARHEGNVTHAADDAQMHRPALLRKLKRLGLSADDFRGAST